MQCDMVQQAAATAATRQAKHTRAAQTAWQGAGSGCSGPSNRRIMATAQQHQHRHALDVSSSLDPDSTSKSLALAPWRSASLAARGAPPSAAAAGSGWAGQDVCLAAEQSNSSNCNDHLQLSLPSAASEWHQDQHGGPLPPLPAACRRRLLDPNPSVPTCCCLAERPCPYPALGAAGPGLPEEPPAQQEARWPGGRGG